MLNSNLITFMTVAETGSLSKAADLLFVSPTSVMKQLNSLENKLGIKLTQRTNQGIQLTEAGQIIYDEGIILRRMAQSAINRAKTVENDSQKKIIIRIGTSSLYPATILTDIWTTAGLLYYKEAKQYQLALVQIRDSVDYALSALGKTVDIVIRPYDSKKICKHLAVTPLGKCKYNVAVPQNSKLAFKEKLTMADFSGCKFTIYDRNDSPVTNELAKALEKIPGIQIAETGYYNLALFNQCTSENSVLLVNSLWKELHPSLVIKPVDWKYEIPYGMLYTQECNAGILSFIDLIRKVNPDTDNVSQ